MAGTSPAMTNFDSVQIETGLSHPIKTQKALAFPRGLFVSIIVSRRFPFFADLAATYFSKP
jgi:hypothetical protein